MEAIAKLQNTAFRDIRRTTIDAFDAHLENNRQRIEAVPRKTFTYGATPRHKLDVYYPPTTTNAPLLIFAYGDGFNTGDRSFPAPSLVHANLGAFFAARGFLTVIPDYRHAPPARYPEPARDVRDAALWALCHAAKIGAPVLGRPFGGRGPHRDRLSRPRAPRGGRRRARDVEGERAEGRAGGFPAGALQVQQPAGVEALLNTYYGGDEAVLEKRPLGLLGTASAEVLRALPEMAFVEGEREPDELLKTAGNFRVLLDRRLGEVGGGAAGWTTSKHVVAKGHNHISVPRAPSSGEGEQWAEEIALYLLQ
ncbi:Alpha/Beta hydrolase protein [Amylostereum chailletii]|nr:Alpha/Beta hydrolase protein [Amylostereum chailletii]